MSLLSSVAELSREFVGIEEVEDLGLVYLGKIGYAACRIEASITALNSIYYLRLLVENQRTAGTKTKVINWPFSDSSPRDLQQFCEDLRIIEGADLVKGSLADNRDGFSRGLDFLFGTRHLGEHYFKPTVSESVLKGLKLKASLTGWGQAVDVTLSESCRPGVMILAQFPHAACAEIRRALVDFALLSVD